VPADMAEALAGLFRTLGHPTRLRILCEISKEGGSACFCDLMARLKVEQSNLSQHLGALRRAGLVRTERKGQGVVCLLSHPEVLELLSAGTEVVACEIQHRQRLLELDQVPPEEVVRNRMRKQGLPS
jgi:ArsR family transcriptional regulator